MPVHFSLPQMHFLHLWIAFIYFLSSSLLSLSRIFLFLLSCSPAPVSQSFIKKLLIGCKINGNQRDCNFRFVFHSWSRPLLKTHIIFSPAWSDIKTQSLSHINSLYKLHTEPAVFPQAYSTECMRFKVLEKTEPGIIHSHNGIKHQHLLSALQLPTTGGL